MRDAAQRSLDAADDDRRLVKHLAHALGVDDDGSIGTLTRCAARRVGIVGTDTAIRGVAVDHGIHVAGGDAEEELRLAENGKRIGAAPVRLGDDADAKSLRLQHPADDRHAEARVIDVGVARDDDDVAGIPAERLHLLACHRQEGGWRQPRRPVLAVGEDIFRRVHSVH